MLKGCKILTGFCVICATLYGGAYGAASVRGGATSRAGSIRTLGAGTTASVKATTSRAQPTTTAANANTESAESVGGMRMSHATGLSGTKLPGKISGTTTSTSGDNQNVAELRQAIEQLRNDYDALGEQYNNLLGDVSNVSDTAQVAHETATNNTNTLTVVRSDLSVAKSDIEDLKATGGFDEERVQEALDTTLAQRNYATRGELAATDAVARGAVQVADLPQTLNALNIADKDYVASRTQGVVNDSLNITLENYYTKGQVNAAIDVAKTGMVDKNYVDNQIDGLAAKTYVDNRVASIQTGVSEGAVQGIINNSIDTRLENYYTKGDIDNAIVDAIGAAKDGMADRDFVNTQVRDTMQYVDEKIAEKESGVDVGTLYNILETRGYKTDTEVRGIVNDSINNTMANYYTKDQVDVAIDTAKKRMVDQNYVDFMVDGLVDESRVNTIVNNRIATLPLGLDQNAVKAVVEGYGYKDGAGVQEMIDASGHVKTSELPDLIKQWAPGAEIQYADGVLTFKDKNGDQQTVDIRGLDGQDGAQVEIRQNDGWIQWHYEGDTEWNNLVAMSDLKGADGKSVKLDVQSMNGYKNALVYSKENESNWQFLYGLDDISGVDGCGVRATQTPVAGGTLVKLLRDCPEQIGDGEVLIQFTVLNGVDGTVSEEQIVAALESNPTFMQLKNKVNNLSDGLNSTNSQVNELSDKVDNNTTGLSATNTLANKAWSKVEDLEETNKTARVYVDDRIGDLGMNQLTWQKFTSVADKLGNIGYTQTVAEYVNEQFSKINTSIEVRRDSNGYVYICNKGTCSSDPHPYSNEWTQISVDLTGYLTKSKADDLYAPISLVSAVDTAQSAATQAQTQASQAWGKLSDLGGDTVKGYVDNTINGRVGSLGINPLTGVSYTVAGKLGFGQGTATQTVKEYIDEKFRSVNTEIMIADGPDGLMYICRKGNTCTTPAGPSNSHEWAAVSVDMSDYLKESDAEREFATITALNGVQTTANEAKAAATTAQTSAAQAQNVANDAQSKADDAWGKLSDLGNTTVREFVEDKVSGLGTTIDVRTVDGTTYICKVGKCLDTPPSNWWEPITVTISDEYLTETEGDELYALKTDIGNLGTGFASVGAKIGLNDSNNSSKTVRQYVDDRIGETGNDNYTGQPKSVVSYLSTNYTPLTKLGNEIGSSQTVAQYITQRIGETGTVTDTWTGQTRPKTVVEFLAGSYVPLTTIGTLGMNSYSVPYTVETKIGLNNGNDANQTVKGYVDGKIGSMGDYSSVADRIGNISANQTIKAYIDNKAPNIQIEPGENGTMWYCTTTHCDKPTGVANGWASFNMSDSLGDFLTESEANGLYALKSVESAVNNETTGLSATYTLANTANTTANNAWDKVKGLDNVSELSDRTVTGYVDHRLGEINGTVKEYIDTHTPTITVMEGSDGNLYICTGGSCTGTPPEGSGWTKLNVDLTEINNAIAGLERDKADKTMLDGYATEQYVDDAIGTLGGDYTNVGDKINISSGTVKSYVDAVDNRIGSLGSREVDGEQKPYTVSEKLGLPADYDDETVAKYIVDYVAEHAASGGVTVKTITNNGVSETYICSENCENNPPCRANDACGWQKLEVDLSQYLKSSEAASIYLPRSDLKLVREGAGIHLKRDDIDYGEIATVQDLMCRSYTMVKVQEGDEEYVEGSVSYKMICNTNGND